MRIVYGAVIPLPPDEAFAFVSDPLNWPSFFSSMHDSSRNEDWGSAEGRGRMSNVVLGRTIISEFEVTVWNPPHEFRYIARQPGSPPLDNRRVLERAPEGTRLNGTTEITPRSGLPGLLDRARMLTLRRIYASAMARLPEAAREYHTPPSD